ncbi:MAG TPA: GNAT family N-acetyltransferase [Thermomicrobiales bacterium]|nr:GNAT family N-acetyltransferase [Thermomicrobiales bacterium]
MDEAGAAVGSEAAVSLREITAETVYAVCMLQLAPGQEEFVASNALSIAQAHFSDKLWFRAVYAGDTPVGFVMLHDDPARAQYFIWRLMIAAEHQGKGFGRRAVALLLDYVRARPGATELLVSYIPGEGGPAGFYRKLGFVDTGRTIGDEVVLRLPVASRPAEMPA